MANPSELRQIIADVLDMPIATLISFDRLLSEAGLRSKAGKGRGAAKMKPRDSAHLLTAIMASPQVRDAVQSVERYAATRLHKTTSTPGAYAGCGILEFESLPKEHSFLDALEALIVWIACGASRASGGPANPLGAGVPIIEVMATTPSTIGDIRISGIGSSVLAVRYTLPSPWADGAAGKEKIKELGKLKAIIRERAARSDLEQFRRITGRTLFQVGEVLAND